tara:strand:+ start:189 stop:362 length:174 start_codon:yes stop_codon:yes gene_type:complete
MTLVLYSTDQKNSDAVFLLDIGLQLWRFDLRGRRRKRKRRRVSVVVVKVVVRVAVQK